MSEKLGYAFALFAFLVILLFGVNLTRNVFKYETADEKLLRLHENFMEDEIPVTEPFTSPGTIQQQVVTHVPTYDDIQAWEDDKRMVERDIVSMTGSSPYDSPGNIVDPLNIVMLPTQKMLLR
jgi:hypothetical protein